jgi:hypothetical protein
MPPKSKRRPAQRSPAQQSPQPAHAARAQATPPPVPAEALPAEPTAKSDEAQAAAVAEQERAAEAAAQQRTEAKASAQASAQAQAAEQARADADAEAASLAFGGAAAPAPSPAPKQQQFVCDNKCGFRGTFTEVEAHERVCPLAPSAAPALAPTPAPAPPAEPAKPRPPAGRPVSTPQVVHSPQPAYTPSPRGGGALPEQYMDVEQVGAPDRDEIRIVVLRWIKESDAKTGKEYVVYVLEVSAAGRRYKIKRRWSEVSDFHAQLKRLNAGLAKPERYKVRFGEKWSSTLDAGMLDGRKAELVKYFAGVTEWAMGPLKKATPPINLLLIPQVSQFLTSSPTGGDDLRISGTGFAASPLPGTNTAPPPPAGGMEEGVPPVDTPASAAAGSSEYEIIARFDEPGVMGFDFNRDTLEVGSLQGPAQEVPHAVVRADTHARTQTDRHEQQPARHSTS